MDLAKIIDLARSTHRWTYGYATSVFIEYERFLFLRSTNDQLSPSSDIDDLWHTHILCTKQYELYCMHKFQKIIHHDALDSIDQTARINRLKNTLVEYKRVFGEYDTHVWVDGTQSPVISPAIETPKLYELSSGRVPDPPSHMSFGRNPVRRC